MTILQLVELYNSFHCMQLFASSHFLKFIPPFSIHIYSDITNMQLTSVCISLRTVSMNTLTCMCVYTYIYKQTLDPLDYHKSQDLTIIQQLFYTYTSQESSIISIGSIKNTKKLDYHCQSQTNHNPHNTFLPSRQYNIFNHPNYVHEGLCMISPINLHYIM